MRRRLNLIEARKKASLTQEQLAREIGTTKTMICNLETCFCGTNVDNWDKLAEVLNESSKKLRKITELQTKEAAISDGRTRKQKQAHHRLPTMISQEEGESNEKHN